MPKRAKTRFPTWTVAPVIAPIPSQGHVRPYEKREPVPWPLGSPLKEIAERFAHEMNLRPEDALPSHALRWAFTQYAEHGELPPLAEWPKASREEARAALDAYRFYLTEGGRINFGFFGEGIGPDRLKGDAYPWLALAILQAHEIPIRRCQACRRFFADPRHRGKKACSIKCGSRVRARIYYANLKAKKPRKFKLLRKKQRDMMRTLRARRAADLE